MSPGFWSDWIWLDRAASLEYTGRISDIRYGIESYGYDKVNCVKCVIVKEITDPE